MSNTNMGVVKAPKVLFFSYLFAISLSIVLIATNFLIDSQASIQREQTVQLIYFLQIISLLSIFLYSTIDTILRTKNNYSQGIKLLRPRFIKILILINLTTGLYASYQYGLLEVISRL